MRVVELKKATTYLLAIGFLLVVGCGVQEVEDPLSVANFKVAQTAFLHGPAGVQSTVFFPYETVLLTLNQRELFGNWETDIQVVRLADRTDIRRLVVLTDPLGRIMNLPIWYHIGFENGQDVNRAGEYVVYIEQANPKGAWNILGIPFTVAHGAPLRAFIYATDAAGRFAAKSMCMPEPVYLQGTGLAKNTSYQLLVVANKSLFTVGEPFVDVSGGIETVTIGSDGVLPQTLVWPMANVPGSYDLVADAAPFGVYNAGDVISDLLLTGLVVQHPAGLADIVAEIAADELGNYRNSFTELEPVYAWVDPIYQPADTSENATVYIVVHRDNWRAGAKLVPLETVGETNSGIECLVNPDAGNMPLHLLHGPAKIWNMPPIRFWPGKYDVIVDVGRNGVYDPGTDIIDGATQVGFTVPGTPPPVRLVAGAVEDFLSGDRTLLRAQLVGPNDEPFVGITVEFQLYKGPGVITPVRAVTDADGVAEVLFTGAVSGEWSFILVRADVNLVRYKETMTIVRKLPYVHNQGVISGG